MPEKRWRPQLLEMGMILDLSIFLRIFKVIFEQAARFKFLTKNYILINIYLYIYHFFVFLHEHILSLPEKFYQKVSKVT